MDRLPAEPGYLHEWLNEHYASIWPKRANPPRIMGGNALAAADQMSCDQFGKLLVARMMDTFKPGHQCPMEFAILDLDQVGAWIIWPEDYYGVLFSKGLVRQIQRVSQAAVKTLPDAISVPEKKRNFFRYMWGDLPTDEEHCSHFASLLGHIVIAFIVHHEIAHAVLGHQYAGGLRSLSAVDCASGDATTDCPQFLEEFSRAIHGEGPAGKDLNSHALETDADVHGMFFTRRLFLDEANDWRTGPEPQTTQHKVWRTLVRDEISTQFMLYIGLAVGLLVLTTDFTGDHIENGFGPTHPPQPSRVLIDFHVLGSLSKYDSLHYESVSAAITAALVFFNEERRERSGHGILKAASGCTSIGDDSGQEKDGSDRWGKFRHIGLVDTWRREEELSSYWESLVEKLRLLAPMLASRSPFSKGFRYQWYLPANTGALRTSPLDV